MSWLLALKLQLHFLARVGGLDVALGRRDAGPLLVGVGVAGDERQALWLGVQVVAAKDAPDTVLGDPDPAPFRAPELG